MSQMCVNERKGVSGRVQLTCVTGRPSAYLCRMHFYISVSASLTGINYPMMLFNDAIDLPSLPGGIRSLVIFGSRTVLCKQGEI